MNNQLLALSVAAIAVVLGTLQSPQACAQDGPKVLASGLNGPMGVLAAPDGSVWVIDSGIGGKEERQFPNVNNYEMTTVTFGPSARVIRVAADGSRTEMASLPSVVIGPGEVAGGGRLAMVDGAVYATSGVWIDGGQGDPWPLMASVVKVDGGQAKEIANTFAVEKQHNPDGGILESNPYGLTAGSDGTLWVVDAGANALLKLDPTTRDVEIAAAFDGIPSPLPNPNRDNRLESDPVPTALAIDKDGSMYVSLLPGFPFLPGSAKVVRVGDDGVVTDYATGLTMLVDLRTGPDGRLYAVSLGQFTEQGPVPGSGAIVRVGTGETSEVILSGLSFPTSVDFTSSGDAYVTINGIGEPGSGQIVVYPGLAAE